VFWVDAWWVVAGVADIFAVWYLSYECSVGESVDVFYISNTVSVGSDSWIFGT